MALHLLTDAECDEVWSDIGKKQKRVREEDDQNLGDAYVFVAIERSTKLVLNIAMGKRAQLTTNTFIEGVQDAIKPGTSFQITTDGFAPYRTSIPDTFGDYVDSVRDLDTKDRNTFLAELQTILDNCDPKPEARFCLAIEEGEAWLLGDLNAVRVAYPGAKGHILDTYVNDSIGGTWETLANAVYPGGEKALSQQGWQAVGAEKARWAEKICPQMNVENNASPSFCLFRDSIRSL